MLALVTESTKPFLFRIFGFVSITRNSRQHWETEDIACLGSADLVSVSHLYIDSEMIREKMTRRLLEEQDKVLRSYFAQKYNQGQGQEEGMDT